MSRRQKPSPASAPDPSSLDATLADTRTTWRSTERLTLRLDDLAEALGVSRRTLERERSAGRFPRPDLLIGKMPLWRPDTVHAWIETQSAGVRGGGPDE